MRNLLLTAGAVLVCAVIGYVIGTAVAWPHRPQTSVTRPSRDGVSTRTEELYVPPSAFAEYNAVRREVVWFCCYTGLATAQAVFVVTHLRSPADGQRPPSGDAA